MDAGTIIAGLRRRGGYPPSDVIRHDQVFLDAQYLLRIAEVAPQFAESSANSLRYVRGLKKNDETNAQHRFAEVLGEGWTYLTGARPSAAPGSDFIRFLATAWVDAGGKIAGAGDDRLNTLFGRLAATAHEKVSGERANAYQSGAVRPWWDAPPL